MNRQLRMAGLIFVLGLTLVLGLWQQQGWAAGQAGVKQASDKLKQLFSPAAASEAFPPAPSPAAAPILAAPMATITVTSRGDGAANAANCPGTGPSCRLRDALAAAAAGDTIRIAVTGTITLNSGELSIAKNLTINGTGAAQLTISGNQASRVFNISSGVTVALNDLTVANGRAAGNCCGDDSMGGGILNKGTLTITNSALSGNSANNFGGGILNSGTLTITHSTLSGNSVTSGGGTGGGIYSTGALTVINSTLSSNSSDHSGGIRNSGTLTIANSTLSGNLANIDGGGIHNLSGTLNFRNTLIAGNTSPSGPDVFGTLTSLGHNLIGNNSGATITQTTGDLIGTAAAPINPLLAPLANYGGPTPTHALLPGSPAINAGNNCVLTNNCASNNLGFNLTTDQRGAGFNRREGSAVDIGAFELRVITVTSLGDGAANAANCPHATNCRLRDAIAKAGASDIINFSVTGTITLNSGELLIDKNLTIQGAGAAQLTISGNHTSAVFVIAYNSNVTIKGLTIANGLCTGGDTGSGIKVHDNGTLTLDACNVSGNDAGLSFGGGIANQGTMNITNCTISDNVAHHQGGGINNSGTMTIVGSTISGNSNTFISNAGGGIFNSGNLTLINSTISGNTAVSGGGIATTQYNNVGQLFLTNCTIYGNTASYAGGLYITGGGGGDQEYPDRRKQP